MKRSRKLLLAGGGALILGALVVANVWFGKKPGVQVFTEKIERRDLEAVVRESGRVRAKTTVPLSANTMGQVKEVRVREGDRVKAGQLLIEIDPTPLATAIAQAEASLMDAETRLKIARAQPERTRRKLKRERELVAATSAERIDELETDLHIQLREVEAAELRVQSEKARLERDRHELTKVRITSPIDGVVLRVNVEKGQNVIMGTMNNAGTELMSVADLSVQEVELEVGELAVLDLDLGQEARVEVDALRDRKMKGRVTEVGTSPLPPQLRQMSGNQERSVAFRAVVTLDETIEGVRPGFSASAEIVTATRSAAIAVPIRALVARELPVDEKGNPVPPPPEGAPKGAADAVLPAVTAAETTTATAKNEKKQLFEGVIVVREDKARFQRVKIGITGKEHVEVLEGLAAGDEVVTGPHKALRDLEEGAAIERRDEKAEAEKAEAEKK